MLKKINLLEAVRQKAEFEFDNHHHRTQLAELTAEASQEAFEKVYARGDKMMKNFFIFHTILAFAFAFVHQTWAISIPTSLFLLATFWASVYFSPRSFTTRVVASFCLQFFVMLHIFQLQGINEARFFFFTAFTMMIVYQDWRAVAAGAILLISQYFVFNYISNSQLSLLNNEYTRLGVYANQNMTGISVAFYFGISILQVFLASFWAYVLSLHTIHEVRSRITLLEKQNEIAQNNANLEKIVAEKTQDLQRALEMAQANEEELRQNMEELQATQDELEKQANQILEKNTQLQIAEKELLQRQSEMERKQWLESNTSQLDNLMRLNYDKDITEFTDIILAHLAELVGAMQGAIYVYKPHKQLLEMVGGYACTPSSVSKSQFMLGDGLLGQVAKNQKILYLPDIKDGAAEVASALTKIRSRSLLVLPMVYNEQLQGLLELATTEAIAPLHLEFLQTVSKNIAAVLLNIQNMSHTKKLLQQSQEMAQEMQKNTQELYQTKAEMDKKMAELKNQYDAINRVMLVIEYAADGAILNVNQNFIELSKYSKEELVGKHQSVFIAPDFVASQEYRQIWERSKSQDYQDSIYKCQDKQGNIFWIKSNYYISGENGNKKFVAFATDITAQKQIEEKLREIQERLLKAEIN